MATMYRTRVLSWVGLAWVLAGCDPTGSAVTRPYEAPASTKSSFDVPVPARLQSQPDEPAPSKPASQSKPPSQKPKVVIKDEMVGRYRLRLDSEQSKQIDATIERLRADVGGGNTQATFALNMAIAARDMAADMQVKITKDGRYVSNFGQGDSKGTVVPSEQGLVLRPDVQSSDPDDPTDMELAFDPATKTLSVDFRGEKMIFVRQ